MMRLMNSSRWKAKTNRPKTNDLYRTDKYSGSLSHSLPNHISD